MKKNGLWIAFVLLSMHVLGQSAYIPLNTYSFHVLDRMEIKQGRLSTPQEFTTTTRVFKREAIAQYLEEYDTSVTHLSKQDYFNLNYLINDNFEYNSSLSTLSKRTIFNSALYEHKAALFDINEQDFKLVINPVMYIQPAYDKTLGVSYLSNVGFELRGKVGNNIAFYTQYSDENNRLSSWNQDFYSQYNVISGAAFIKTSDKRTFNYWQASGYAVLQAGKYFDIQLGHGRNFFGNGFRSLMMSDFSRDHLFLRVNTRVWKIHYSNIWGQHYDYVRPSQSVLPKRHYFATTHASINLTSKLNIGLFQTISFQRDSGYSNGGFDAQYLNPIIFYKPIENGLNSPDKAILGADFKYNFAKHFSFYGQFVISEMVFGQFFSGNGWSGNKNAYQLGLKYIDVFNVKNLDFQIEYNQARPYMYTSFNRLNAYVNFNQNVAHPLGANFRECIGIVRFQPTEKVMLKGLFIYSMYGNDTNNSNWGRDIRLSYKNVERQFGNVIGQGVKTQQLTADVSASYMFRHNMFIDLQFVYRKTVSDLVLFERNTIWIGMALRINIAQRYCHY